MAVLFSMRDGPMRSGTRRVADEHGNRLADQHKAKDGRNGVPHRADDESHGAIGSNTRTRVSSGVRLSRAAEPICRIAEEIRARRLRCAISGAVLCACFTTATNRHQFIAIVSVADTPVCYGLRLYSSSS